MSTYGSYYKVDNEHDSSDLLVHTTNNNTDSNINTNTYNTYKDIIVNVRVEIRKGSVVKYEWSDEHKALCVDRMLHGSEHYRFNYGEIIGSLGGDGDALDAVILTEPKLEPSCIVECRVIGLLKTVDEKGEDDKIIVVPVKDPDMYSVVDISDVSNGTLDKIKSFFQNYKNLEPGKFVNVGTFVGKKEAEDIIHKCMMI